MVGDAHVLAGLVELLVALAGVGDGGGDHGGWRPSRPPVDRTPRYDAGGDPVDPERDTAFGDLRHHPHDLSGSGAVGEFGQYLLAGFVEQRGVVVLRTGQQSVEAAGGGAGQVERRSRYPRRGPAATGVECVPELVGVTDDLQVAGFGAIEKVEDRDGEAIRTRGPR
ncbi:hypothetical protein [Nocardia testacea]|uniref:hypothetical protein n=1 Tax=Nocardia testacea TaxID=248551 RepID=UPI0033D5EEC1